MRWSPEQVRAAAPDASSLTAARKLAHPAPWQETGANDALVWGQCQGSGKKPYQVSVDLHGPAYRCSCPSRKFPCKHALALLMLWSEGALDEGSEAAGFASEWAAGRADRAASRERTTTSARTPDPEAQAKRLAERLALMDAGVEEFRLWLSDLARAGLAAARQQPASWWERAAARLVDSQLSGLAERVREASSQIHSRSDWSDHLLGEVGRWWAITAAWRQRDSLDPGELADLRVAVGWSQPSGPVRDADSHPGPWTVLGAHRSDDGRLQRQRTWLRRDDGELVMVLDFAGQGESLAAPQLTGARLDVEVARYPGTAPQRALFIDPPRADGVATSLASTTTVAEAIAASAARLSAAPWRDLHPATLAAVRLGGEPGDWWVRDATAALPLAADVEPWLLLGVSGGQPVDLFGEIEAGAFRPLSAWFGTRAVTL